MFTPEVTPIQPINVIVQQAPGMPEWVKILISAGVGALFGIVGSLMTEFLKTHFAKRALKKVLTEQLVSELSENLDYAETCCETLMTSASGSTETRNDAIARASGTAKYINNDRYKHYFIGEKLLVYKIDPDKSLADFYKHVTLARTAIEEVDFDFTTINFKMAVLTGLRFLRSQGQGRDRRPMLYEQLHNDAVAAKGGKSS
jgi:hypothetical protein